MLESALKEQLKGIFAGLEANFTFDISVSSSHENKTELLELLGDVADCSDHITCSVNEGEALKFTLLKNSDRTGITFRGIPNGHEFTSLLLAILNLDGKGKNFPDEAVCNRVKALKGPIHLTTYVSLICTNCPDVVQALNAMVTLNPAITHEMVDGALYQDEVDALKIQGVPSVFADGKLLHVGRGEFGELLAKLEEQYGIDEIKANAEVNGVCRHLYINDILLSYGNRLFYHTHESKLQNISSLGPDAVVAVCITYCSCLSTFYGYRYTWQCFITRVGNGSSDVDCLCM